MPLSPEGEGTLLTSSLLSEAFAQGHRPGCRILQIDETCQMDTYFLVPAPAWDADLRRNKGVSIDDAPLPSPFFTSSLLSEAFAQGHRPGRRILQIDETRLVPTLLRGNAYITLTVSCSHAGAWEQAEANLSRRRNKGVRGARGGLTLRCPSPLKRGRHQRFAQGHRLILQIDEARFVVPTRGRGSRADATLLSRGKHTLR